MARSKIINLVGNYFSKRGKVLTEAEYRKLSDQPVRLSTIKVNFGSWPRFINLIGDLSKYPGVLPTKSTYTIEDQTPEVHEEPVVILKEIVRARKTTEK
jgi:hypothetical protein